jgi:ribose transport system permease protein
VAGPQGPVTAPSALNGDRMSVNAEPRAVTGDTGPGAQQPADLVVPLGRQLAVLAVRYGMFVALLIWIVVMSFSTEHFFSSTNLLNVARQAAPIIIIGVGMTFVMATAGIDLSVGAVVALISCLAASWLALGLSVWIVVPLLLLVGAVLGGINGLAVWAGIPAFIVTLAALVSVRGLAFVYSDGYAVPVTDEAFIWLGRGSILGINTPFVLATVVALVGWFLLNRTRFGLHTLAVGGREEAARVMGLRIGVIKLAVYAITGALAALGGIVVTARLANGSPNAGMSMELDVIAAVVLGGTSLFGGSATIVGTVVGALFINFIRNGLNLMNVDPYWVQVVTGIVLVLAVLLNSVVNRRVVQWARRGAEGRR